MLNTLLEEINGSAEFSPCGNYRYLLTREWADGKSVAWLMLNSSMAGADKDDPTIKRVVGFSKSWGYGRCVVVNLAAYISPHPKRLKFAQDPIGPLTDYWIKEAVSDARELICAWGSNQHLCTPILLERPANLLKKIRGWNPYEILLPFQCLGNNKDGSPKHPLYLNPNTPRRAYSG